MDLREIRDKIDEIDDKIFELYKERMELSREVAMEKIGKNLPIENQTRENEILSRMSEKSDELMIYTKVLYNTLFSLSKSYQNKIISEEKED